MPISVSCANVSYIHKDQCLVVVSLKRQQDTDLFFFCNCRLFLFLCFVCISFICYTLEYAPHNLANCDVTWGQRDCCLQLIWHVWGLTESLCFCRWPLAQRLEWDGEHRPCLVLAASARAGSPLSGVSTLPQRKKQKPIPASTRSLGFFSYFQVSRWSVQLP